MLQTYKSPSVRVGQDELLNLTLSITIACSLFADDVVLVLLGPKWTDTVAIVRLLAPTIVIFAFRSDWQRGY